MRLEDLVPKAELQGILPDVSVRIETIEWHGTDALSLSYRDPEGRLHEQLLYRSDEENLQLIESHCPWSFDGDGSLFRLVAEARRIRLAYLFDPVLAIHSSLVEPLPHQITAVYEAMLPRQPLRFLLADDPGAGKTIMAGLLIKELMIRGDLQRCLIVCPGSIAEQWQDELYQRFHLPFEILTNAALETAHSGNWFLEKPLVIARLDKCSRDERVQEKLSAEDCRYDLIICDEAHKFSATYFGTEVKYTKRYNLGRLLSRITRHFLLMTATPHNGKEADFQLFLRLLDEDRFAGVYRNESYKVDISDLMRRMVKENLLKFDGKPLFPERFAHTVPYHLSEKEDQLYKRVTEYVREEFNRVEALQNNKKRTTVGFALTILQRRLASSPEAIYQSLSRRRQRLEKRLEEFKQLQQYLLDDTFIPDYDWEDLDELDDLPENELLSMEETVIDEATAAKSITELKLELETLASLEALADSVRQSGADTKWRELSTLLQEIFTVENLHGEMAEAPEAYGADPAAKPKASPRQKLVIFTEHRDTLNYLATKISDLFGRPEGLVIIHGAVRREDRRRAQEAFLHDPDVQILMATDAAGEGINLQRAHLMVNYDLPWNPNRLEQRFGRIHRIGQTEPCHLWNLIADGTREGDVYRRLLDKLEEARKALGGKVFDVLGTLHFEGKPLRDLLIEAIRYGDQPEVRMRLEKSIEDGVNRDVLQELLEKRSLARDVMDTSRVMKVRQEMERAEARRLQPFYIESFFLEAFSRLGGTAHAREQRRFEITHVPAAVRQHDVPATSNAPVLRRYERIVFEKDLINQTGQVPAAFISPGHSLLNAVIDMTLQRHRDLLKRGTILADDTDSGTAPRVLFFLEHAIQDACLLPSGERRIISRRLFYVERDEAGIMRHLSYAPYLDYRPLKEEEPSVDEVLSHPLCKWIQASLEDQIKNYAIGTGAAEHFSEVQKQRREQIEKTRKAVHTRLSKEIHHWDHRAAVLKSQEEAGKAGARLNSQEAGKTADELSARREKRMEELDREEKLSALPPVVLGGVVVLPAGFLTQWQEENAPAPAPAPSVDTQATAARAREIVMAIERELGYEPTDREFERLGYDIESREPHSGKLRFIEVKGRIHGADTITVTKNEILYFFNKPDSFILALVIFMPDGSHETKYLRRPFRREPDFNVTSVNYTLADLLAQGEEPS